MERPTYYQLVGFLDTTPELDELVYGGDKGWFAQIALKRRFMTPDISENDMMSRVARFCTQQEPLRIEVGDLVKPDRMPVRVLEVKPSEQLMSFHKDFIAHFGDDMVSKFPEREGDNYYPHITAEYNDQFVIDADKYASQTFTIDNVCLIKDDSSSQDSRMLASFDLS